MRPLPHVDQRPHDVAMTVVHPEVANMHAPHARDCAVNECVCGQAYQREHGNLAYRCSKRGVALAPELPQQVAFGDDTGGTIGLHRINVKRTDFVIDHLRHGVAQADVGVDH